VHVAVSATPGALAMTISDDGVGLPEDAGRTRGSFGLLGIEERVTMLGGTFSFRGAPGQGTTISVSIPLATHGGPANHTPPPGERAASPERRARTSSGQASRPCRE
jgi:signal transduction histidine kinase